jgi:uncharacterized protein
MKNNPSRLTYLALACLAIFFACTQSSALDTVSIEIEGTQFTIEVARTLEEQQRGLMFRRSMKENHGMIFVYEDDRTREFWMKNTLIPLSIAYISSDGVIREIYDMEPQSLRGVSSVRSVRYALELNRGAFERIGAQVGSKVEFPPDF